MFKHWGEPEQFTIDCLKFFVCYALGVITDWYICSNWCCLVVIAVYLYLSYSIRFANLDFCCFYVSLSFVLVLFSLPSKSFSLSLTLSIFMWQYNNQYLEKSSAINPPWHGWMDKPYFGESVSFGMVDHKSYLENQ